MDEGDAYIYGPGYEGALNFAVGAGVLLLLAPTLIWITWAMLRRRRKN